MVKNIKYNRLIKQFREKVLEKASVFDSAIYDTGKGGVLLIVSISGHIFDIKLKNILNYGIDYGAPIDYIISEINNRFNTRQIIIYVDGKEYKKE